MTARSGRLRIFTEDEELDFAGHPVLGAGGAGRLCPGGVPEQVAAGLAAVFSAVT